MSAVLAQQNVAVWVLEGVIIDLAARKSPLPLTLGLHMIFVVHLQNISLRHVTKIALVAQFIEHTNPQLDSAFQLAFAVTIILSAALHTIGSKAVLRLPEILW
jgi:hypothetical protein